MIMILVCLPTNKKNTFSSFPSFQLTGIQRNPDVLLKKKTEIEQ